MHIQTHVMSGWVVGNLLPLRPRERLFCMLAASVQDVDGLGVVMGMNSDAYQKYHHVLAHNLLFCAVVAVGLAIFSARKWLALPTYFALAHLHLVLDYYGSGPGWPICYWWPFERGPGACWLNEGAWAFFSWQNIGTAFALLGWTVWIGYRYKRTPLELLMPSLDRRLVGRAEGAREPVATRD